MLRWAVSCLLAQRTAPAGGVQDVLAQRQDEASLFCRG